jgi:hypothetical protein
MQVVGVNALEQRSGRACRFVASPQT